MGSGPTTGERSAGRTRTLTNITNTHGLLIAEQQAVCRTETSICCCVCQIWFSGMCAVFLCCDMMTSERLIIDTLVICINAAVFFSALDYSGCVDVNIYSRTKCAELIPPQYELAQFVSRSTNYRLIMLLFTIHYSYNRFNPLLTQ